MTKSLLLCFLAIISIGLYGNGNYEESIVYGNKAHSKIYGASILRLKSYTNVPNYIKFRDNYQWKETQLNSWLKQFYPRQQAFSSELVRKENDRLGYTHARYQQVYKDIPIEHSQYILHIKNGLVQSMNGEFLNEIILDVTPSINEETALKLALNHIDAKSYMWEDANAEKFIKREQGDPNATYLPKGELKIAYNNGDFSQKPHLVYKFDIYAQSPMSRSYVYVDAHTGEIIMKLERIHTADTPGTANTQYSGNRGIITDSFSGGYRLREAGRGNGIETYNMQSGDVYLNAVDFVDADNIWNNVNAQQDEYATDVHWGTEVTYDYFMNVHGRNSIDGNGYKINSYVHFLPLGKTFFINAFWDGSRMTYGDGEVGVATPVTSVDVEGHEITHGLVEYTAGLIYATESGALNESFADIFGTCIDFFARSIAVPGSNSPNWKIGDEIFTNGTDYIRDMADPNNKNDPKCYTGTYWIPTLGCTPGNGNDQCGVHTNSGVQNFWFYLLTNGGSGTNDLGDAYIVNGLGINDAEDIAFRNLSVYLTASSDYLDARFFAIQSATDIFGACSPEVGATTDAWYAVGVGAAYTAGVFADFTADITSSCSAPLTVNFTNLTFNAVSNDWDFGDATTSTVVDPTHTYTSYGTYTVELIVDGGVCGSDTMVKVAYITIDSLLPCNIIMIPNDTSQTQTKCVGNLFDDGGAQGQYSPAQDSYITIDPPSATSVSLTFIQFDIETGSGNNTSDPCDYDYIEIFDGDDIGDPLIGKYCNVTGNPGSVASTGGPITVHFHSDPGLELDGFEIAWSCSSNPVPAAVADFDAPITTVCEGGTVNFNNLSSNASSFSWSFPGGVPGTSTAYNPVISYPTAGTYNVVLTATNASGNDVETKTGYIIVDPNIPCEYISLPGNNPILSSCDGIIYDDGGPTSNYSEGYDSYVTIAPASAAQIEFTFTSFGVEPGSGNNPVEPCDFDFIELFDGASINAPSLGRFCDANAPTIGSVITSAGATVTMHFHSDPSTVDIGYVLNWHCLNSGNALPTADFTTQSTTACEGQPITFVNTSINATSYAWSFPGGTPSSSTQANPVINYNIAGTYTITLAVTNTSGTDIEVKTSYIVVNPGPKAAFSFSQTGNFSVSFTDLSLNSTNVLWDFSDGSSSPQPNPVHVFDTANTYLVCLYASDPASGCPANQTCKSVTVDTSSGTGYFPVSVAGISSPFVCAGSTVSFFDQSSNVPISWEWDFQGGTPSNSTQQYPVITYTSPGTYDVTLIVNNGIGSDTAYYQDSITVLDPSTSNFSSISSTLTTNFTDLSLNATSWLWDFGDASGSITQNPTHTYATGGVYHVCLTVSNDACPDNVFCTEVTVVNGAGPLPTAIFTQNIDTVCEGEVITFSDLSTAGILGWQWFFDSGFPDTSYVQNPTVTYNTSGFHDVTLVVNNVNGYDTLKMINTVFIKGAPNATWNYFGNGLDVQFYNYSNHNDTWLWGFGEGGSDSTMNPIYSFSSPGVYFVCLQAENSLCLQDIQCDTITILAVGSTSIEEISEEISFTVYPNPTNSELFIRPSNSTNKSIEVVLLDLAGRLILNEVFANIEANSVYSLDLNSISSGSYILRIDRSAFKVIKE